LSAHLLSNDSDSCSYFVNLYDYCLKLNFLGCIKYIRKKCANLLEIRVVNPWGRSSINHCALLG
jgi:hypothetical protein